MPDYPAWIPNEIVAGYIEHGIQTLLSWQCDVLNNQFLQAPQYGNFIFSAPTSAGKTIVAELIAVNTVRQLHCKAVFIFPYISVAKEKFLILQKIWRRVDLRISAFMGSHSSPFQAWDASVCTIEKANSLLNRMIDDKTIFHIGVLVIDEFHMLFDGNRGPLVEQIVAKVLYISQFLNHRIQIIGLSATLPNLDELADWLNAEKYETEFRPIQLHEMIMCDNELRDVNTMQYIRTISSEYVIPNDMEHVIIHLCTESVTKGESVLVFCSSKAETEKLALAISHHFKECFKSGNNQNLIFSLNMESLKEFKQTFDHEVLFVDDILQKTLPYGIAFHHAGLTVEEREMIENAFHEQSLRVICATSTLSSGINLPAHRVIIKAQMSGPIALNSLTYMQMIGRAGRLGQTEKGESIVVCSKNQLALVQRIIQQKAIFARRCEVRRRRIKLIIEAICSGLCKDENDLENLLSLLFFERKITIKNELNFLITRKLICHQKDFGLCGTQLGRAVYTSSLPPDIALQVYDDLEKAMHSLALDTELHLLYLVTPLHNDSIWMNYIDWNVYYNIWSKLPTRLQRVGKMVGILDSFILGKIQGRQATETSSMQIHLRFLSALALYDLIRECPLAIVARRFCINRGALQTLQQQSATYAYMIVTFCEKLGWTYLRNVLDGFSERLAFGVRKDLTELVQIEGIDGIRARAFHNANITTVPILAITSIDDVTKILRSVVPYIRRDNNEGLNRWLAGESLMTDIEAAEILIQRARLHLSSSIRAIGIFSDTKIDSLLSTVTSICETNHASLDALSSKCDNNNMDSHSVFSDFEPASHNFSMHGNFPITTTSENSEEQNTTSTQCLIQTSEVIEIEKRSSKMKLLGSNNLYQMEQVVLHDSLVIKQENPNVPDKFDSDNVEQFEVIEKRPSKMKLLESDNLDQMEQVVLRNSLVIKQENPDVPDKFDSDNVEQFEVNEKQPSKMKLLSSDNLDEVSKSILHDHSVINQENSNIPAILVSDNVEQLCVDFAQTSMSDETLLQFGCSQYSDKYEQITQALDAIAVLARNEQCAEIKSDELIDQKIFESLDISNAIKNEAQMISTTTATSAVIHNMQDDNVEMNEKKHFINSKLKKSSINQSIGSSSTIEYVASQQIILESIDEEKGIVSNSDESIGNRSVFNNSNDLFDRTYCSSISSQSFNTPQNSSYCMKRISRRSSINHQSPKSPSFQSPLHKMLKPGSPFMQSVEKEAKYNESIKNDTKHFDSNQANTAEFEIIDVCRSRTAWKQLLIRQKNWNEIGLGIAIYNNDIIGIALCTTNDECVYIDFKPNYTSEIEIHECLRVLDNILKSKQQKYIYDLLSFSRSLRYLRDTNCQTLSFNHCICIQTLSYLAHYRTLNNDSALSFQDLITQLTSPERAIILRNATPRLQAAITAFICLHMHNDLMSAAIRLSSTKSVELELQSVILFSEIEIMGISFDMNKAKILNSMIKQKLTEIEAKAYRIAGISFNFCSAAEISQVLFVRLQIPPPNISTGRHYSTNKIALQRLAPNYPIINLILEWRRLNTALTTSLPALLNSSCADGRIRANFIVHCCTGRVLTAHPNVQNVQKDAIIDGLSIRSLFIAPKDRILLSSDYRQLEMRMLAHLSADPQLISLFFTEGDFFEIITNRWNNDETLNIKIDRNKVKQLCYGIIYGMGATSLSKELDIDKQHAQQMIVSFFQQFPKVRTWMDKILTICRTDGFVSTLLGRRRFLPQINGVLQTESAQAQRQAINTCIQGSVAELFKIALLNLQKNLSGTNSSIVMQIHDEVLIETDECSIATIVEIIKHSMTSVIPNLRIPLAVKISYGKSWGELREYVEI